MRKFEPRYEKTGFFLYAKTKTQISCAVTAQVISAFVFATRIVQSLYYINPKFQASSHLLWLYSPICVGPGRKPRSPVFSQRGSFYSKQLNFLALCFLLNVLSALKGTHFYILISLCFTLCCFFHISFSSV